MNIYSTAIVGVTGYSGREADRILKYHPSIKVTGRFASKDGSGVEAYGLEAVKRSAPDVVLTATEHDVSMRIVPELLDAGLRVIDMSGAFRMKDPALYPKWYGFEHTSPALLKEAVYGLTEIFAGKVRSAKLVANPGCYATSVILPLAPLYTIGAIDRETFVVVDGKSGVSGAGRHPKQETHFCEVNENLRAYGVLKHRHTPEMLSCLPGASTENFVFTPHLIPITRGILSTIVLRPSSGYSVRAILGDKYTDSKFVKLFPEGTLPDLHGVVNTNGCHLGVATSGRNTVIVSAIDNLVKGAAGQAIENLNLMLGLPVETGLLR
ncbi:MAG TPA: N-acetyl-gamma-glutamyl-phosphate reductase [Terriglobia bacterium]|nr:N-acetyl-gamma-glutamyl-phosphate reductase [Terriglobia bacterium]